MASTSLSHGQDQDKVTTQAPVAHSMAELRPGQIVLLREGSVLVQTTGILRKNAHGQWMFVIQMPDAQNGELELILLPCTTFEEMQRIANSIDHRSLAFETTGEVFVYQNRNYFLPTHAPHMVETHQPVAKRTEDQLESTVEETTSAEDENDVDSDDDSIESIMNRLDEKSGPIARSSADEPIAQTQPMERELLSDGGTLREGATLIDRRGHLTRGKRGSWVFVFDADAEGLSDPPITVLPCLMLQRMQDIARQRSNIAPMLLSGRVFEYQGRRYVLPTLYRIPQTRTLIVP